MDICGGKGRIVGLMIYRKRDVCALILKKGTSKTQILTR